MNSQRKKSCRSARPDKGFSYVEGGGGMGGGTGLVAEAEGYRDDGRTDGLRQDRDKLDCLFDIAYLTRIMSAYIREAPLDFN